jgi:hypothetical protein
MWWYSAEASERLPSRVDALFPEVAVPDGGALNPLPLLTALP